jgi:hypothetical protein
LQEKLSKRKISRLEIRLMKKLKTKSKISMVIIKIKMEKIDRELDLQ